MEKGTGTHGETDLPSDRREGTATEPTPPADGRERKAGDIAKKVYEEAIDKAAEGVHG